MAIKKCGERQRLAEQLCTLAREFAATLRWPVIPDDYRCAHGLLTWHLTQGFCHIGYGHTRIWGCNEAAQEVLVIGGDQNADRRVRVCQKDRVLLLQRKNSSSSLVSVMRAPSRLEVGVPNGLTGR
jgi:hypothetical protein